MNNAGPADAYTTIFLDIYEVFVVIFRVTYQHTAIEAKCRTSSPRVTDAEFRVSAESLDQSIFVKTLL